MLVLSFDCKFVSIHPLLKFKNVHQYEAAIAIFVSFSKFSFGCRGKKTMMIRYVTSCGMVTHPVIEVCCRFFNIYE